MPTATTSRKGIGGPKTAEGKRRVSLNALKHGLNAQSDQGLDAVAETIGATFSDVHIEMCDYYKPRDPVEALLVRRIARAKWRLMITEAMEDRILSRCGINNCPNKSHERIILMERRVDLQLHRAINALAEKRNRDRENAQNKLADLSHRSHMSYASHDPRPPTPRPRGDSVAHPQATPKHSEQGIVRVRAGGHAASQGIMLSGPVRGQPTAGEGCSTQ